MKDMDAVLNHDVRYDPLQRVAVRLLDEIGYTQRFKARDRGWGWCGRCPHSNSTVPGIFSHRLDLNQFSGCRYSVRAGTTLPAISISRSLRRNRIRPPIFTKGIRRRRTQARIVLIFSRRRAAASDTVNKSLSIAALTSLHPRLNGCGGNAPYTFDFSAR